MSQKLLFFTLPKAKRAIFPSSTFERSPRRLTSSRRRRSTSGRSYGARVLVAELVGDRVRSREEQLRFEHRACYPGTRWRISDSGTQNERRAIDFDGRARPDPFGETRVYLLDQPLPPVIDDSGQVPAPVRLPTVGIDEAILVAQVP